MRVCVCGGVRFRGYVVVLNQTVEVRKLGWLEIITIVTY